MRVWDHGGNLSRGRQGFENGRDGPRDHGRMGYDGRDGDNGDCGDILSGVRRCFWGICGPWRITSRGSGWRCGGGDCGMLFCCSWWGGCGGILSGCWRLSCYWRVSRHWNRCSCCSCSCNCSCSCSCSCSRRWWRRICVDWRRVNGGRRWWAGCRHGCCLC